MSLAFLFDLNRCTGCHACILACANENGTLPGRNWRQVVTLNEFRYPGLPLINLSLACNHCAEPACLINCPANAFKQDPETGAVVVDQDRCLGCTYCTWACPFDAPRYNSETGVIEKCDFCLERLKKGLEPACVTCCPTGALQLTERRDEDKEQPHVPGFSRTRLKPAVEFVALRAARSFPEITAPQGRTAVCNALSNMLLPPPRKITLRSEWALLIFTTLATVLVSTFTVGVWRSLQLNPILFLGAGAGAMIFSTVHLGRKERAWRAIFNWRRSWLSLEILFFLMFMGSSGLYLLFLAGLPLLGWAAVGLGFCTLFAVDRIYQKAMKVGPGNFHSGQTLFNGLYLTGILASAPLLFAPAGLIKLGLYCYRKMLTRRQGLAIRPLLSLARIAMGFIMPALFIAVFPEKISILPGMAAIVVIGGDLIDRVEFYQDLEVITPAGQMLADLRERLLSMAREV
jgi:DMSO reductase iron-sulfur subunit